MEKIIVNMVESDCGMREIVVRVSDPWVADLEEEHRVIPVVWNFEESLK